MTSLVGPTADMLEHPSFRYSPDFTNGFDSEARTFEGNSNGFNYKIYLAFEGILPASALKGAGEFSWNATIEAVDSNDTTEAANKSFSQNFYGSHFCFFFKRTETSRLVKILAFARDREHASLQTITW